MVDPATLKALLSLDEGVRRFPYADTTGRLTIGIGHNLSDLGITSAVVDLLFTEDLHAAQGFLQMCLPSWIQMDDARQAVMLDLAFNLGHRLLGLTTFLSFMVRREYEEAATDLETATEWYHQVGARGPRLVGMLRTGQWPTDLTRP